MALKFSLTIVREKRRFLRAYRVSVTYRCRMDTFNIGCDSAASLSVGTLILCLLTVSGNGMPSGYRKPKTVRIG